MRTFQMRFPTRPNPPSPTPRLRRAAPAAALLAASVLLGACSTEMQYYADAGHNDVYYGEIAKKQPVTVMRVEAAFYDNGKLQAGVEPALLSEIYRVLGKLGVITVSTDPNTPAVLRVELRDQHGASTENSGQMFLSGLTLGKISAEGNTDHYDFTISYHDAKGDDRFGRYRHSVWTTTGEHPAKPSDRGPFTAHDAISTVIEDVLLQFFKDLQGSDSDADGVMFVPDPK